MTLRGNAVLAPADATAVIRTGAQTPVTGKLSGELVFESTGSSPAALVAGLRGGGIVSLDNGRIAGLDIKAIDAAARVAERGPAPTPQLVTDIVTKALDAGTLSVPRASAPVELANGRARLGKLVTPDASDVTLSGGLDFVEEAARSALHACRFWCSRCARAAAGTHGALQGAGLGAAPHGRCLGANELADLAIG